MIKAFIPADHQVPFPGGDFIVQMEEPPAVDDIQLDVLFVGAGPASLSSAIHLAQLAKSRNHNIEIGIMEKADQIGGHTLSGAVINPLVFKWLFSDKTPEELPLRKKVEKEAFYFLTRQKAFPIPLLPDMKAKHCWTASLCEVVRFLAKRAEELGAHIFTSFPAEKLLMNQDKVIGVSSKAYGLNKDGTKTDNAEPASRIFSKIVVLSEGSRGHLTQSYTQNQKLSSRYPQTYALGVKEIWEVKQEPDKIFHSLGWPLNTKTFGGSWCYPLGEGLVSLGLVAGLDSPSAQLSIHEELQKMKSHPLFKKYLAGGKCIEWGAKTIPEGGYHALTNRLSGNGVLILGDSAGFVNMASLKGVHYAMASGYYSAEVIISAFDKKDFSHAVLKEYDQKIKNSFIAKDLYIYRNLRQSFHRGLLTGLMRAGLIAMTRGYLPFDFKDSQLKEDAQVKKQIYPSSTFHEGISKVNAVYLSGNKTRDKIPSHLLKKDNLNKELALFYEKCVLLECMSKKRAG